MLQTEMTNELLESAIVEIEQHTSKQFNDVQKRFWRDNLGNYTQEVIERSWTDFIKQLQPFRYPSWQVVEPIFKSNKEQLSYEPPVQIGKQEKLYGSRINQAIQRGFNANNKSDYHKVMAEQFKKENEPDMVENHLLLSEKAINGGYKETKKKFY